MPIHTALGPISSEGLGPTSMHEHLLIDAAVWHTPSPDPPPAGDRVVLENLGHLRWNAHGLRDNLVLDDPDLAAEELVGVRQAGGSGIVDLTVVGIGPRPAELPGIARATGLHVMCGCGWYVHDSHPPALEQAGVDELAATLMAELADGVGGTGVRPALIGEIGTSSPITDRERRCLRAAGVAAAQSGAAVNVHVDPVGAHGLEAIDVLVAEGADPARIVLSHMDEHMDLGYHRAVAEAGAVVEYDTFGSEFYWGSLQREPTDLERFAGVRYLLDRGHADRLVLGCDIWLKTGLRRYGGMGYDHLLRRVVPALRNAYGVSEADLNAMLVATPRRILDRP